MMGIFSNLFGIGKPAIDFKTLFLQGAIIVDVRSVDEFKAGHIPQSQNIPLQTLEQKLDVLKKKNKKIITVCQSGARSGMATTILTKAGMEAFNGGNWSALQNKLQ
jgi:rhodanese-related sulfurtransferase